MAVRADFCPASAGHRFLHSGKIDAYIDSVFGSIRGSWTLFLFYGVQNDETP
jgi:hypothetical protein